MEYFEKEFLKIYVDLIMPEYLKYINEDNRLEPDSKKIRRRSAQELKKFIRERFVHEKD